jgi:hypothetical protein
MATRSEIRQILFDWIKDESGLRVIIANQGAHEPAKPYVSLHVFTSSAEIGGQDQQRVDEDGNTITSGMRRLTASVNIFGANAIDTLTSIRDSLDRPDIIEYFEKNGIAELDRGGILDLTALEETEYEERAQLDIAIAYTTESSADVGTIETFRIEGEADEIPVVVTNVV